MYVDKISIENNPKFGIAISTETVRRANRACIERSKLASRKGLVLAEYDALHREDFIQRIGNKTFDFHAMSERILANKEKIKEAFGDAWNKIL